MNALQIQGAFSMKPGTSRRAYAKDCTRRLSAETQLGRKTLAGGVCWHRRAMFFRSLNCDPTGAAGRSGAVTKVMKTTWLPAVIRVGAAASLLGAGWCMPALSQQVFLPLRQPMAIEPGFAVRPVPAEPLPSAPSHRFWDRENRILFAMVAASSAADFAVTRANLHNGGRELNPVTRVFSGSTAGLALNFSGETAGAIGLSYFFHKTGHHKLERIVSMTNIGASGAAIAYGLGHR